MIPQRSAAGLSPLAAAALLSILPLSACSGDVDEPAGAPAATPVDPAAVAALVADTWPAHAAHAPAVVEGLLDAPGGAGWLHLFHGDLDRAEEEFKTGGVAPSARLGLARVHLARAAYLAEAADLHAEAALELARWRRDHGDQVRPGAYDLIAAALAATARAGDVEPTERAAFLSAAVEGLQAGREGADLQLGKALGALAHRRADVGDPARAAVPDELPEAYRARLRFASKTAAGDAASSERGFFAAPDFVDPRGGDGSGVSFDADVRDSVPIRATAREELRRAWRLASGLEGPGEHIRVAVRAAWGGDLPTFAEGEALSAGPAPLPPWTALFLSPVADAADWAAYWGEPSAVSFATRWDAVFGAPTEDADAMAVVDDLLRRGEGKRALLRAALVDGAPDAGTSLIDDLDLSRRLADRVLRTRMVDLVEAGNAAPAKRLADRSLDPNPGAKGGAEDSRETRVSYRNDRAFLVALARCLHRAGQTGAALAYIHPLAKRDARLLGVELYLGRLDAAGSIGVAGKASQL